MTTVTLQRMTVLCETHNPAIYTPSILARPVVMSYEEFIAKFADNPKPLLLSKAETVTGYNLGQLNHWYVVVDSEPESEPVVTIRSKK